MLIFFLVFGVCPMKKYLLCFISIVGVHCIHKTEKFQFWNSLKYFNIFGKKWCQIWTCTIKHCLIWFKIHCSSSIFEIIWEMWILNFTESLFGLKVVLSFFCFFVLVLLVFFGITIEIVWSYLQVSKKFFFSNF